MKGRSEVGMTLMEVIIVIFLFTIISVALLALFDQHNTIYNFESALVKSSGSARTVMNEINIAALQAHRVLASQTINGTTYNSGANILVLQLPAVNGSGTIIANNWDYMAFYTSGTQVLEQIQAASGSFRITGLRLLSSSLNAINFTYDNGSFASVKNVTVDLKTQESYKAQVIQNHLNQQIRLRNY